MKTHRKPRLVAIESLEDRCVPSGFAGGLIGSIPAQDARLVSQAFEKFEQSYETAVRADLIAPKTPNTTQFQTDSTAAFAALTSGINAAIKNLPSTATNTSGVSIATDVANQVTALQNELNTRTAVPVSTSRDAGKLQRDVDRDIARTSSAVVREVQSAPAPAGTIDSNTLSQALSRVAAAFGTFNQAYANAIRNDLLKPATPNTAGFKTDVTTAVNTLNSDVATALKGLPSGLTATLDATVQNDLVGGATSLQGRLGNLTLPQSNGFLRVLLFRIRAGVTIAGGESQVISDVVNGVRTYNNSLSGTA